MVIQISYELKRPNQDYNNLYAAINAIPGQKIRVMTSHWFVDTGLNPTQVYNLLIPHIFNNDCILVSRLTREHQGFLFTDVINWLKSRVQF